MFILLFNRKKILPLIVLMIRDPVMIMVKDSVAYDAWISSIASFPCFQFLYIHDQVRQGRQHPPESKKLTSQ